MTLNIYLAGPRGFCAGVERAISIVEKALEKFGPPIYVRHEIVHNKFVVDSLKEKGAIFVKEIAEVPEGSIVIFSAHGVSRKVENDAIAQNLKIFDATCPLVTKVHLEAQSQEKKGKKIILIGHEGHPEVEGTSGRVNGNVALVSSISDVDSLNFINGDDLAYVTQTTLSVDDTKNIIKRLKEKYPTISGPELKDICYATQNRQQATKKMVEIVDLLLVIGADNSSNSNRLRDIGLEMGKKALLIDSYKDIKLEWLENITNIGITAGASAPEVLVKKVIEFFQQKFSIQIHDFTVIEENIHFNVPKELR